MILWAVLMAVLFAAFIGGIFYLISRLRKFQWVRKAAGGKKKLEILLGAVTVIIPAAIIWVAWGQMNAIICILHLIVFWAVSDGIFALVKNRERKNSKDTMQESQQLYLRLFIWQPDGMVHITYGRKIIP